MQKRYVSIWFPYLLADWQLIRRPELAKVPFVFAAPDHGRMVITAVSPLAQSGGAEVGMRLADARAICPGLEMLDDKPGRNVKLLKGLGAWCIRYSPIVAIDEFSTEGLLMEVTGCTHLWDGEGEYLKAIQHQLQSKGYQSRLGMADTVGAAWAVSHFGTRTPLVPPGAHGEALLSLPTEALRMEQSTLSKLHKLGFYHIRSLMGMPRSVLRRRFGEAFLSRLGQALGTVDELIKPLEPPVPFQERLPCLEPIRTRAGIEVAIGRLLGNLCLLLKGEGKGIRKALLGCYRVDGKVIRLEVGTNGASHDAAHLLKLFQLKIEQIRPEWGIELFVLEAQKVEDVRPGQEMLWSAKPGLDDQSVIRLLDRLEGKVGAGAIHRYLPAARYWPERSIKRSVCFDEKLNMEWAADWPRPTELLDQPEPVEVMALIPDHPPKLFIYKGTRHAVMKADGPERIEREWWLDEGEHRDYYQVEDEQGQRYWLFRSGHYGHKHYKWFIHGFFA